MRYRPLGRSGIMVSEIGFGGWGIGGATEGPTSYGPTDDEESIRALEKAFDQGVNFFDTANIYGRSEKLIGKTFKNRRSQVIIATKVGFIDHNEPQNFSRNNLVNSLHKSLRNLQTDYVDLYQLHSPKINEINLNEIEESLGVLKMTGLIRAFGVSVKSPDDGLAVMKLGGFCSLQVNLSMVDQRAIDNNLIQQAQFKGVGVIARTPFCFGFLSGKITDLNFGLNDHRSQWPMKQLKAWQKAAQLFSEINPYQGRPLSQFALRFCLDTPGTSVVIPGMITVDDVLENVVASELPSLSQATIKQIYQIYKNNDGFFIRPS